MAAVREIVIGGNAGRVLSIALGHCTANLGLSANKLTVERVIVMVDNWHDATCYGYTKAIVIVHDVENYRTHRMTVEVRLNALRGEEEVEVDGRKFV